jgi:hypothetical protein
MNYTLNLLLSTGNSDSQMNLTVLDRNKNVLPMKLTQQPGLWSLSMEISMPNKLLIYLTGKDQPHNHDVFFEVKHMSLGGIRVNNKKLNDCFEYKTDRNNLHESPMPIDHYMSLDSDKTIHWDQNGVAILELFDVDPIRYHLHIETTGLTTI